MSNPTADVKPGPTPTIVVDPSDRAEFVQLLLDEFLAPVIPVIGLSEVLIRDAGETVPPQVRRFMEKMHVASRELLVLVDESIQSSVAEGQVDIEQTLITIRSEIGEKLNTVTGYCQLLIRIDHEKLFDTFQVDLQRIKGHCDECQNKLLRYANLDPQAIIDRVRQRRSLPTKDRLGGASHAKILLVDDSSSAREGLERLLRHENHDVVSATGGADALQLLTEHRVDVLLVDDLMPQMSGMELLGRIKNDERLAHMPVLIMSWPTQEKKVQYIELGAEDVLSKPIDPVLLRARLRSCLEKKRLREKVLEQFLPSDMARTFAEKPELLHQGRNAEVTVLFCDIRGFSRISKKQSDRPEETVAWVSDVMEAITKSVLEHHGVVVSYIGDELMAMWGAPQEQPDHALLACNAALDMLSRVEKVSLEWEDRIGEPTRVGIGINTGTARVGNTGTRRRIQYGPLGNTVNIASRVQGATKHVKSPVLITESTYNHIADSDHQPSVRRLFKVRVVNINTPITLYEVSPHGDQTSAFEQALQCYEQKDFKRSASLLSYILDDDAPDDGPARLLLAKVSQLLVDEPEDFDPVWDLDGK